MAEDESKLRRSELKELNIIAFSFIYLFSYMYIVTSVTLQFNDEKINIFTQEIFIFQCNSSSCQYIEFSNEY